VIKPSLLPLSSSFSNTVSPRRHAGRDAAVRVAHDGDFATLLEERLGRGQQGGDVGFPGQTGRLDAHCREIRHDEVDFVCGERMFQGVVEVRGVPGAGG